MTLADPDNYCEYSRCLLSMIGSVSYLWSLVFARVSCGCLLGAGLRVFWVLPITVVLFPMDRRYFLSSSLSSTIPIQIDTGYAQNFNRLICARPKYYWGIFNLPALPFELKPPMPISRTSDSREEVSS